jgi:hypothetical protein
MKILQTLRLNSKKAFPMTLSVLSSAANGSVAMSTREMRDLLQNAIAEPIEHAEKVAEVNADIRSKLPIVLEDGVGETVDITIYPLGFAKM